MTSHKVMRSSRQTGFTLLELLLSLSIFAILSTLAYGGLQQLLQQQQQLQQRQQRLQQIQTTMQLLERDLGQLVARPVRDAYGDPVAALTATNNNTGRIAFTVTDALHPNAANGNQLRRAGYEHKEEKLWRHYWQQLDITQTTPVRHYPVLDQVSGLQWRFRHPNGHWINYWPPAGDALDTLPQATEVTLTTTDYGAIRRVIMGPGELP